MILPQFRDGNNDNGLLSGDWDVSRVINMIRNVQKQVVGGLKFGSVFYVDLLQCHAIYLMHVSVHLLWKSYRSCQCCEISSLLVDVQTSRLWEAGVNVW